MPVLSPHRNSVTGAYRSSLGSSSLNRYPSSTYTPNFYYERYSTRSYTDTDGRRIFSRSGSITEDGKTTRFYEESCDGNLSTSRRESLSRDSGIGSIRENSILESRRENSLTRDPSNRYTQVNVVDSLSDLRIKYSPANYVPAIHRNKHTTTNQDRISRSKSINDIGKPPPPTTNQEKSSERSEKDLEVRTGVKSKTTQNKVIKTSGLFNNGHNGVIGVNSNNINLNNDSNGNETTINREESPPKPVSELRKKFESKFLQQDNKNENQNRLLLKNNTKNNDIAKNDTQSVKKNDIKIVKKKSEKNNDNTLPSSSSTTINSQLKPLSKSSQIKVIVNGVPATLKESQTIVDPEDDDYVTESNGTTATEESAQTSITISINDDYNSVATAPPGISSSSTSVVLPGSSRVSNFSSYIPVKTYEKGDLNGGDVKNGEIHDLSTSQPLNSRTLTRNNATASTSSSSSSANNNRVSLERDEEKIYDRKQTLLGGASQGGGLNGLKNIGNTCFMNSVIQCLSNTKPLLEYLRKDQYANEINTSISSMKGALIKAFAQVTKELWSEDSMDRVVNTVSLKSQIQRFAPRFMGYAQQDAQEFLRYLLEGLHEDVNRVTSKPAPIHTEIDEKLSDSEKSAESWQRYLRMDNSKIVDIFVGQLKSTLKCTHCGHCSVTFDPFWDLSLPIPQKVGPIRLQQCLDSFTREETLDGDEKPTCSKCKERRKCTKSFTIQKFPKILVIHLKRFSPMERFRGKLSVTVDFPLEGLDMSNYAADNRSQSRYNLYAISNHSGTTYSGHYTAYCRHPYSQSWHEYNDSRVCLISPKNIISGEAYVLFYELDGQKSHL
nr:ubiquitin carboxyl-terminal hydrolase Usp2 isoform X1 [Onthophagus taurus]